MTLGVYALTAGGHLYSPDDEILFRTTRSIFEDGDLAIEPLLGFATREGTDGKQYAQYGIGQPLLATPLYAIGKWLAPIGSNETWRRLYGIAPDEPSGRRAFLPVAEQIAPRFTVSFFNLFTAAALAALVFLIAFEITGHRRAALLAFALYAFGSLAWPHSRPFFTETAAVLFIVLAWYALLRSTHGSAIQWTLIAGAAAGFAALVRVDSILMYPGLALVLLGPVRRACADRRSTILAFAAFCIPAALMGGVLLGLNALHFGGPFQTGYTDQPEGVAFSAPILAGLYGFLFSAGKGMFFFSPALALGLCGWRLLGKRDPWLAAAVALSLLVPLAVQAKWPNWAGGWCWGPRHIFMIHPFLALPAALWLADGWNAVRRSVALGVLAIGAAVQLLGCSQDFMEFYRTFYRGPASFRVLYDDFDRQYWEQRYLPIAPDRAGEPMPRFSLEAIPAPTQHSIYIPQSSVWSGYPLMWRQYRLIDNLWIRLVRQ